MWSNPFSALNKAVIKDFLKTILLVVFAKEE